MKKKKRYSLLLQVAAFFLIGVITTGIMSYVSEQKLSEDSVKQQTEILASQIAVSDASDAVTTQVNRVIADIMRQGDYDADSFVSFEKNANGEVTAISSNMSRINALSAEILDRVVGATENRMLTVRIPMGNLTGISLLMGRGPAVPVQIIALTSSHVGFNNSIVTAGINQTKHQINLEVTVDIDILVPWGTENTQVKTDVLIADTIVVGQVPGTYLNMK